MRRARILLVAALGCAAASVGGCGGGDDPTADDGRVTAQALLTALGARDGDDACARLTDEARRDLAAGRGTCPEAVERLPARDAAEWAAMARGDITVDPGAGLDAWRFSVSYAFDGPRTGDGLLSPPVAGAGFKVSAIPPPTPAAQR